MTAYTQFHGRHVLPVSGGWADQSAGFAAFVGAVDAERAWWDEQKERARQQEERKRASKDLPGAAWGQGGRRG